MIFLILEYILIYIFFLIIFILMIIYLIIFLVDEIRKLNDLLEKGMLVIFFCIIGLLVIYWIFLEYFLLSDLYELFIFFLWSFVLIYIILYFIKNIKFLSKIISLSVIFI